MRKIVKTHVPQALSSWRTENRDFNHTYNDLLGTEAHRVLKIRLLEEQGKICAYTGRRINLATSHVEHLKPQNQCADWEDVDYRNMVACFPKDGGDVLHGYGAPVKKGWWDENLFISPLSDDCERRFRFTWSGQIYPDPEDYEGAKKTIEILGLNNKNLCQLRKSRILGFFGFGSRTQKNFLQLKEAKILLNRIDQLNGNGELCEFCFVLKQLLPKYIENGAR
jgi:uncharacterized protein (TIGR02646 family)